MEIKKIIPELVVKDVKKTVEYYNKFFGFKLTNKVGTGGSYNWAQMQLGNRIEIMFISAEAVLDDLAGFDQKNIGGGGSILFVETENVEAIHNMVKVSETIVKPINKTFYGTEEFVMKDLNGYVLIFSQRNE